MESRETTINSIAREAWATTRDIQKAREVFLSAVGSDPPFKAKWVAELMETAADGLVREAMRKDRSAKWNAFERECAAPPDRKAALEWSAARNLLDMAIPGGKTLGEACRSDLDYATAFYRRQADEELKRAAFLETVRDGLKHHATKVKSAWTPEMLEIAFNELVGGERAA